MVGVMKLTYFCPQNRNFTAESAMKKFIDKQIKLHYVFMRLKVGGQSIAAAYEGQKVGGPRPAQ